MIRPFPRSAHEWRAVASVKLFAITLAALLNMAPVATSAASLEGQTLDDRITLAARELQLNGIGLRGVLFIKAYVAGLYTPVKVTSYAELATLPGPRRLHLRMLLSAGPEDFISPMVDGIRKNTSEAEMAGLAERMEQLQRSIRAFGGTAAGDDIHFDYLPEQGTILTVNGKSSGAPIPGLDFYNAVLRVFVGDRPVDNKLKAGLLAQ
jgi:hypothetical protein